MFLFRWKKNTGLCIWKKGFSWTFGKASRGEIFFFIWFYSILKAPKIYFVFFYQLQKCWKNFNVKSYYWTIQFKDSFILHYFHLRFFFIFVFWKKKKIFNFFEKKKISKFFRKKNSGFVYRKLGLRKCFRDLHHLKFQVYYFFFISQKKPKYIL